jgi:hypothetical protein
MSYATSILSDNPVAYLRLGEPSGTSAVDASGNGNDGTTNGLTHGVPGLLIGSDLNTACTIPGTGGGITIPDAGIMLGTTFTIDFLIKIIAWGVGDTIIERRTAGNAGGFALVMDVEGTLAFYVHSGAFQAAVSTGWALDTTYHVGLIVDAAGNYGRVRRDGVQVGTVNVGVIDTPVADIKIGVSATDANVLNATLDEVALYDTNIGTTRLDAHYAESIIPSEWGREYDSFQLR